MTWKQQQSVKKQRNHFDVMSMTKHFFFHTVPCPGHKCFFQSVQYYVCKMKNIDCEGNNRANLYMTVALYQTL